MLLSILLGIKKENLTKNPEYIRVLGLNDVGAKALKHIKQTSTLPIITKISTVENLPKSAILDLKADIKATDIYYSCAELLTDSRPDYINSPVKL